MRCALLTIRFTLLLLPALLACPPAECAPRPNACSQPTFANPPLINAIRVLSLNLHGVTDENLVLQGLHQDGALDDADVMLLQEVIRRSTENSTVADRMAQTLGMHAFFAPAFSRGKGNVEGLAILTRYPQLDHRIIWLPQFNLRWKSRTRIALAAQLETPAGALMVYDVHLDTRVNLPQRLAQLKPLAEEASMAEGPVFIGGDFNTNPYLWFQHTIPLFFGADQPAGVQRYLGTFGFQSAFPRKTVTSRWFDMHLDWIFFRNARVRGADTGPMAFSDHFVISACFDLTSKGSLGQQVLEEPQYVHKGQAGKSSE